ncbi:MAG: sigma-54 dependent transcriptional regulator [Calditrichia bacterium]
MNNILVVDDEKEMLESYERILKRAGYDVSTQTSPLSALELVKNSNGFNLIICDLKMPEMDGMEFLNVVKREFPYLPVIMVTGYGSLEVGVEAVKSGAFDFIEKPFSSSKLLNAVQEALKQIAPDFRDEAVGGFENIVGSSAQMQQVYEMIRKVSFSEANVLITGESGVGKELVARSIHKNSLRRNHALIPINCAALPESLFESELFGYEKGAFTGAFQSKPGLIELANGGTLFLDEVSEMPQHLQVKLLRVLQDRKIRRVGGQKEIAVNVRIVSATNRDLDKALQEGWLREDFYYRINTFQINIPPLRERVEDVPLLAKHFITDLEQKYGRNVSGIEELAIEALRKYNWPGNVRELQNVLERTYYLANPPQIRLSDLPSYVVQCLDRDAEKNWLNLPYHAAKEQVLESFEKKYLTHQLQINSWNISQTAEKCGIDRRTIHRLIKKYQIKS